jgi:DNA helicase IV
VLPAEEAEIIEQEERLAARAQHALLAAEAPGRREKRAGAVPPVAAPYFAHLRLEMRGRARDVLVGTGSFIDGPSGITIIDWRTAPLAKGLEFDYVIVPDAGAAEYPDTPEARRALHVAVTRAIHQLWVAWSGARSPLLAGAPGSPDRG